MVTTNNCRTEKQCVLLLQRQISLLTQTNRFRTLASKLEYGFNGMYMSDYHCHLVIYLLQKHQ